MMSPVPGAAWLFCPADRPDRYARALESASTAIIDLEDAVAVERKQEARQALLANAELLDPGRTIVRINALDTPHGHADLEALKGTMLRTIMLPKASTAAEVDSLEGFDVIALCESAAGVLAAEQLALADNCVGITWGGQDLALDLGAAATRDDDGTLKPFALHARTTVRYAAAKAQIPAIDTVWIAIDDLDGLARDARRAADEGFAAKLAIHPSQVEVIDRAFIPTQAQVEAARRVVAAAERSGDGAAASGGQMLDRPVVEQAKATLARAHRS